jgi:hypothetical protein
MLCLAAVADAGEPTALTDAQLDRLSARGVIVVGNAASQATGLITMATTQSNSIYGSNRGADGGSGSEGGIAAGTAVAFTSGQTQGALPASSSTDVSTGGTAEGNFTVTITGGGKATAGGLTIQMGFTATYGASIPGFQLSERGSSF